MSVSLFGRGSIKPEDELEESVFFRSPCFPNDRRTVEFDVFNEETRHNRRYERQAKHRLKRFRQRRFDGNQSPPQKRKVCDKLRPSKEQHDEVDLHAVRPKSVNGNDRTLSVHPSKSTASRSRERRPTPWQKRKPKDSCFVVKSKEMAMFFKLTEDEGIHQFLCHDSCCKIADKYLLAMVFAYFKRADLSLWEYTRMNFFLFLYLANDVEEDEEEAKYEIFPWALGRKWKDKYPGFLQKRDRLLQLIDYKAIVSRRCAEEIMSIEPGHPLWKRDRPQHHGGAVRSYMKDPSDDGYPRGPNISPRYCQLCDAQDSQYDSASPSSTTWYIASAGSTPEKMDDIWMTGSSGKTGSACSFDMQGLKTTLPISDAVISCNEE